MNPNEIQFESYWRGKISKEISLFSLVNASILTVDELDLLDDVKRFICEKPW